MPSLICVVLAISNVRPEKEETNQVQYVIQVGCSIRSCCRLQEHRVQLTYLLKLAESVMFVSRNELWSTYDVRENIQICEQCSRARAQLHPAHECCVWFKPKTNGALNGLPKLVDVVGLVHALLLALAWLLYRWSCGCSRVYRRRGPTSEGRSSYGGWPRY
jgi:hypothetical protein